MAQMAAVGGFKAHGIYVPDKNGATADIQTGATGWTHFLMARRQMPNENQTARGFVLMYINTNTNLRLCVFNPSTGSLYPNAANAGEIGTLVIINGTVIEKRGIASQTGTLESGIEYEWWCW